MAHTYQLQVGDIVFNDNEILSIPENTSVDIAGNELSIDECTPIVFVVNYDAQSFAPRGYDLMRTSNGKIFCTNKTFSGSKISDVTRGTELKVIVDGASKAVYYIEEVRRITETNYELICISGIGLLENKYHVGGLFLLNDLVRFVDLVAEMVGGTIGEIVNGMYPISGGTFTCYVETSLGNQIISGRLPYDTARNNLHRIMLAYGASLTKAENGDIIFSYLLHSDSPTLIDSSNIYNNGKVNYSKPASIVQIQEHTFIDRGTSDEAVTVFDSSLEGPANNTLVLFQEPLHDLTGSGTLTIVNSNCNYAIVSGAGTLTGYKYTHSSKLMQKGTSVAKDNVISVNDLEIITAANSANLLDRLYNYYTNSKTAEISIVLDDEKCGREYSFTNAFGQSDVGYITKMDINASGVRKANATIVTGYIPMSQGNNYSSSTLLTGSGSWTVPEGITKCRAIILGAGQGGTKGEDGTQGSRIDAGGFAGRAGNGGQAGSGGKVYSIDIENLTPGSAITYACGVGGTNGALGTATTFGSYSSSSGEYTPMGIVNLFTGDVFAVNGRPGIKGADGGDNTSSTPKQNGKDVLAYGATYKGGIGGAHYRYVDGEGFFVRIYDHWGGGGGGAAVGVDGGNSSATMDYPDTYGGGAGASPIPATEVTYGCGGNGGHGGGGGGAGGTWYIYANGDEYSGTSAGGLGGTGSVGSKGGDGCIIIYY